MAANSVQASGLYSLQLAARHVHYPLVSTCCCQNHQVSMNAQRADRSVVLSLTLMLCCVMQEQQLEIVGSAAPEDSRGHTHMSVAERHLWAMLQVTRRAKDAVLPANGLLLVGYPTAATAAATTAATAAAATAASNGYSSSSDSSSSDGSSGAQEQGLLSYAEVMSAALHYDGRLRLSALTLLTCDSRGTTMPAPHEVALLMEVRRCCIIQ
jgi:hypothetical protein